MYLLTLILGIVLLPEASTLNCYQCYSGQNGTCTNITTTQCSLQENQCGAQRYVLYKGGSKIRDGIWKSCVLPEHCGEQSYSYGDYRILSTIKCCTSDLCNNQSAPEPIPTENGKKCFTCYGLTCNKTLNCVGNEDYCFSQTVDNPDATNFTTKGCASEIYCSNLRSAWITRANETGSSYCQGDYCNGVSSTSARSTSAGLLLLVTPLISLILN